MKKVFIILFASLLYLQSCSSQIYMEPKELANTLASGEFLFTAKRANPTNYSVINSVSGIPNATSTRLLDLGPGYGITFKKNQIDVVLPYFGRGYRSSSALDQASFRFTSKDFGLEKSMNKKNRLTYTITPRDISYVQKIYLEVYPSGSAMVSVDANDRQPITYDGYIEKLNLKN